MIQREANKMDQHTLEQTVLLETITQAEAATDALAALLEEETRLLRAGALKEALALASHKANLSLAHSRAAHRVRNHAVALHRHRREEALVYREKERALLKAAETNVQLLGLLRTALDSVMRHALQETNSTASPYSKSGHVIPADRTAHRLLSVRS